MNAKEVASMKSGNLFNSATGVLILLALAAGPVSLLEGCAASSKSESTGQYVDDSAITAKVKEAIFKDPDLKVNQIGVETYKGVVQLSGFVDNAEKVRKAGDIAASVPGVVSVKNNLIVK
jgi:osmotically-inducible protein OsmY